PALLSPHPPHGDAEQDRTLRLLVLIGFCALYGTYLLVLRLSNPTVHGLNIFPSSINLLMGGIAILTTPILAVAAVDFGEWGQLSGARILGLVGSGGLVGRIGRWFVPAAGCAALLAIAWTSPSSPVGNHLYRVMQSVILVAVVVAIMIAAGALLRVQRRSWPETLNFAGIFVVVALTFSIIPVAVGRAQGLLKVVAPAEVSASGEFTAAASVQSSRGSSGFTMLVPLAWGQTRSASGSDVFSDANHNYGDLLLLVEHLKLGPSDSILSIATSAGLGTPQGSVKTDGGVQFLALRPAAQYRSADIWLRKTPGTAQAYLFLGTSFALTAIATKSDPPGATKLLNAIVRSFRPPGTPPAAIPSVAEDTPAYAQQATSDRLNLVTDAVELVLSLIALILMVCVGRAWSGRVRGAVLLLGAVTLTDILFDLGALSRVLFGGRTRLLPGIGVPGLLFGVGILGLITLAVAGLSGSRWAARVRRNLTGLVVGVLALRGMETLYDRALSASRVAVWAAIIVLVAMAWDIAMSGESMTNHASKSFPRSSRIFLFFGYVILLACAVVYFSGQHTAGSGSALKEAFFEPEAITQSGLFLVAWPLLLLLFLLRTFGEQQPAAAVHGPQAGPSPAAGQPGGAQTIAKEGRSFGAVRRVEAAWDLFGDRSATGGPEELRVATISRRAK
ncbi:MAG: hypothetical protein ACR2LF_01070, partial [Jatrophihabitantaceae bacterium]